MNRSPETNIFFCKVTPFTSKILLILKEVFILKELGKLWKDVSLKGRNIMTLEGWHSLVLWVLKALSGRREGKVRIPDTTDGLLVYFFVCFYGTIIKSRAADTCYTTELYSQPSKGIENVVYLYPEHLLAILNKSQKTVISFLVDEKKTRLLETQRNVLKHK